MTVVNFLAMCEEDENDDYNKYSHTNNCSIYIYK